MIFAALALAATLVTLDGDTFDLDGERIRIANMDAPETIHAKCDAELRLGKVASRRLDALLRSGPLTIRRGVPKSGRMIDKHGWTLATIEVDGRHVAAIMIAEGLARPWEGRRRSWCEGERDDRNLRNR